MAKTRYTAVGLRKAVERYFAGISRTAPVTEPVPTGELDRKGRPLFEERIVHNDAGETIQRTEFLVPPTVGGLCQALGISRQTWASYADDQKHPEFAETVRAARDRLVAYLVEQTLLRDGRDTKGPMFVLAQAYADYGFGERHEIELGPRASEAMSMRDKQAALQEIAESLRADGGWWGDGDADAGADG